MKKLIALLLALVFVCAAFAACGTNEDEKTTAADEEEKDTGVVGKTFIYESFEIIYENEETKNFFEENSTMQSMFSSIDTMYKGATYSFTSEEATCVMSGISQSGKYTMEGNKITSFDDQPLDGNTKMYYENGRFFLVISESTDLDESLSYSIKLTFKQQ